MCSSISYNHNSREAEPRSKHISAASNTCPLSEVCQNWKMSLKSKSSFKTVRNEILEITYLCRYLQCYHDPNNNKEP